MTLFSLHPLPVTPAVPQLITQQQGPQSEDGRAFCLQLRQRGHFSICLSKLCPVSPQCYLEVIDYISGKYSFVWNKHHTDWFLITLPIPGKSSKSAPSYYQIWSILQRNRVKLKNGQLHFGLVFTQTNSAAWVTNRLGLICITHIALVGVLVPCTASGLLNTQ